MYFTKGKGGRARDEDVLAEYGTEQREQQSELEGRGMGRARWGGGGRATEGFTRMVTATTMVTIGLQ